MCGPTAGCTATLVATAATPGCRLPPSSALFTTQASALLSLVALRKEEVGNGEGIQEDMSEGACRGGGRGGHIMVVLRPSFHASTNRAIVRAASDRLLIFSAGCTREPKQYKGSSIKFAKQ